ncbi:MAG: hypothetical protein ABI882_24110, partial [Acidobacteriota bacterium]
MGLWKRKIPFAILLVTAMLALLPVLAVLQYRSLGRVSEAERERMKGNLNQAILHFRQDFDREIARAYLHFQAPADIELKQISAKYSTMLAEWSSKSANPGLVSDLYWVDTSKRPHLELKRFEPSTGTLVTIDWPADLTAWRDRVARTEDPPDSQMRSLKFFIDDLTGRIASPQPKGDRPREVAIARSAPTSETHSRASDVGPMIHILRNTDASFVRPSQRILEAVPALIIPVSSGASTVERSQAPASSVG